MIRLTFLGAARTVTGSKYLLETGGRKILIDCGLFQGLKDLRLRNWQPLPFEAADLSAAVLTHAHLDHTGYLPRLVVDGYRGRVFCTAGTADLCKLVLPDSARLQEEDAREANRLHYSKHSPALPLYRESDAFRALSLLQTVSFNKPMTLIDGVDIEFINAGHLLGSSFIRMTIQGGPTILFGGDLGRYSRPVLPDPSPPPEADVLLLESTYGDRIHAPDDQGARLAAIIKDTIARGGKVIIPSFAIGRVEEVLYWLKHLEDRNEIPKLPVFLDSPMALEALRYYSSRHDELDDNTSSGAQIRRFYTARFQPVSSAQQSAELVRSKIPSIVVSSSGMATGGRVLYHLQNALPDKRSTVLFVGYQAAGTRGRQLLDGAREVKIRGQFVPVNARIEKIDSMSAHADSEETLRWLGGFKTPPKVTYLVHGEAVPMDTLKATIQSRLHWNVQTPEHLQAVELGCGGSSLFSSRVRHVAGRNRLAAALDNRKASGLPVIDLTLSNPTRAGFAYPPGLLEPLSHADALRYEPHPLGLPSARQAVSDEFARRGVDVAPDRVVLTASTSEGYSLLFKLLCNPGDTVLAPRPSYPLIEHLAELDGLLLEYYPLEFHGRWTIDLDQLSSRLSEQGTNRVRAVIIVSPNNPTGSVVSERELASLASIARQHDAALISDEVFADYSFDGRACPSAMAFQDGLTFVLGGLSKSIGLPQVKLGWIGVGGQAAVVADAMDRLETICDAYLSVSTPVQIAAPELLRTGAPLRAQIQDRIRGNYATLCGKTATNAACSVLPAEGGWYGVVQVPATTSEEVFVVRLLESRGVLLHPGYFFDFEREAFMVISLLPEPDGFASGIDALFGAVA